jgi:hypothetical protein
MIPDRDYYADKNGKLTTDTSQAAIQVAVAGCVLDPRVAKRYGITDAVVSVDEPGAIRRVARGAMSEPEPESDESPAEEPAAAEAADAASPKAEAKKPAAKKGAKKK